MTTFHRLNPTYLAFTLGICLFIESSDRSLFAKTEVDKNCEENYAALQKLPDTTKGNFWQSYFRFFKKNEPCMDGEGTSDLTATWLVKYWKEINGVAQAPDSFKNFILKNINATLPPEQLKAIATLAKTQCPTGKASLTKFCLALSEATKDALKEPTLPNPDFNNPSNPDFNK